MTSCARWGRIPFGLAFGVSLAMATHSEGFIANHAHPVIIDGSDDPLADIDIGEPGMVSTKPLLDVGPHHVHTWRFPELVQGRRWCDPRSHTGWVPVIIPLQPEVLQGQLSALGVGDLIPQYTTGWSRNIGAELKGKSSPKTKGRSTLHTQKSQTNMRSARLMTCWPAGGVVSSVMAGILRVPFS